MRHAARIDLTDAAFHGNGDFLSETLDAFPTLFAKKNLMNRLLPALNWSCCVRMVTLVQSISFGMLSAPSLFAQSTTATLVRVEEDWVALIAEPDAGTSSPQILNFISPLQSTSGVFGLVQVNHRGAPQFQGGGLQVQGWVGSWLSGATQDTKTAILYRNSDRLRYTVAMQVVSNGIRFELLNGRSRTWGRFAQTPVAVTVSVNNPTLEHYSPDFSVANSVVNLGAHRVDLLYLTTSRRIYSDGEVITDGTDRANHRYQLRVEDVSLTAYEQNPDEYNVDITE